MSPMNPASWAESPSEAASLARPLTPLGTSGWGSHMDGNTCSSAKASLIPVGFPALQGQRPGPTVSRFQPHECPQSFIPSTGALVGPSSSCCVPQLARATGAEGGIPLSLLPLLTLPQASHSLPLSVSISVSLCFSVSACLHLSVSVSLCLCISLCLSLFVCLSCCLCVFPLLLPWTCQAQPRVLGITVVSLGNLFDWIERGAWLSLGAGAIAGTQQATVPAQELVQVLQ